MPKIIDPATRRATFAEAAARTLGRYGLGRLTLREVAKEAGFSPGLIRHYFENQEDLLVEACRWVHRRQAGRFLVAVGGGGGMGILERSLASLLPLDEERADDWRVRLALPNPGNSPGPLAAMEAASQNALVAQIAKLLRKSSDLGELRSDIQHDEQALALAALVTGLATSHHFAPETFGTETLRTALRSYLRNLAIGTSSTAFEE